MTLNAAEIAAFTSSGKDDWETPWPLFEKYNAEFQFTLDVCASDHNAKCKRYFTEATDGLAQDWGTEVCWMNPPYSRGEPLFPSAIVIFRPLKEGMNAND